MDKYKNYMNWPSIVKKLFIPFSVIVAMKVFIVWNTHYLCDCFFNSFGKITVVLISMIFFSALIIISMAMKRKNKEWKWVYTGAAITLYIVITGIVFFVGDKLYVPYGGRF